MTLWWYGAGRPPCAGYRDDDKLDGQGLHDDDNKKQTLSSSFKKENGDEQIPMLCPFVCEHDVADGHSGPGRRDDATSDGWMDIAPEDSFIRQRNSLARNRI